VEERIDPRSTSAEREERYARWRDAVNRTLTSADQLRRR
jgi:glycerol kinase